MQHSIHTVARQGGHGRRRTRPTRWSTRRAAAVAVGALITAVGIGVEGAGAGAPGTGAGTVAPIGEAGFFGDAAGNAITGMARTSTGEGYWLASSRGAVFAFGDAPFSGSATVAPSVTVVDIAGAPDGRGYWLVAADGGVYNFGSAVFQGSAGESPLNQPIVGMAATPSGNGYWLVARDGGVFSFGDAPVLGSAGGAQLNRPIVGMAATPSGAGYWLVASDGGIFAFGDAPFIGSTSMLRLGEPIVGMASTPTGGGYWLVARDGGIFTFGDAEFHGSLSGARSGPIVDIEAAAGGAGEWLATGGRYLGDFELTCYALRGTTASGKPVSRQGVAVDPRVIPLGSEIYIDGEGTRTAVDTGGAIKGNRIDIWRPSAAECRAFGRKTVPVFSLN